MVEEGIGAGYTTIRIEKKGRENMNESSVPAPIFIKQSL